MRKIALLTMISRVCLIGVTSSIGLVLALALGGCATTNDAPMPAPVVNTPAARDADKADPARKLIPNDIVSMTVFGQEDLTTKVTIEKSGMVMLPLVGEVKLAGLTTAEATAKIQKLYDKNYLINPQVNLRVEEFAKLSFSVLGQVKNPGRYDFHENQSVNLLEAIAEAGGYTRLSNPDNVSVRRVEGGDAKIYQEDAGAMSKDTKQKVFVILPDDVITVGERTF
jgi:protein involved in polysaccharide export with SLBB domain